MSIVRLHAIVFYALLLALEARASAMGIFIDYTYDSGMRADARAVLEQAARDLGDLLATAPAAVTADKFSGTSGTATVSFDWSLTFPNPATGLTVTLPTFTAAANSVVIYAGFRPLSGNALLSTDFVHAGETVSAPVNPGTAAAGALAASASNAMMPRADGPTIGSYVVNVGGNVFSLRYGAFGGSISFDNDVDNNGSADPASLDSYWSFSLAGPVAGKYDFYTAALRGMVQALGFGKSEAWLALADGTTWNGPRAAAFFGGGENIITSDGFIASGLPGMSLVDGTSQVALMAPGLDLGTRRNVTTLDVAFMADQGFRFVPEPSEAGLLAMGAALLATRRKRSAYEHRPPPPRRFHLV